MKRGKTGKEKRERQNPVKAGDRRRENLLQRFAALLF
jgi:hypothetical protein